MIRCRNCLPIYACHDSVKACERVNCQDPEEETMNNPHQVLYLLVTKGGGVDGRDHTDKGGDVVGVFAFHETATKSPRAPWCEIVPTAVDIDATARQAANRLTPVERFCLAMKREKYLNSK